MYASIDTFICCLLSCTAHGETPDQLMQALLPVIDRATCNQPQWHNYTVDDSMVCAGYEEGQLGNCYVSITALILSYCLNVTRVRL